MESLTQLLNFFLHLDVHLNYLAGQLDLWFYLVLFLVVFCETGLVVTPFLPGDSLLFALGALCAATGSTLNLPAILLLLIGAAILGDAVNYAIGAYLGPRAFKYDNSWLLNKKHLLRAQEFYERYGSKTIILARFVPIVRTFAPFVAGIGRMRYGKFLAYNVVGAVAWVALCLYAGFFFGQVEWVKKNFELVVLAIILISVLPMAVEMVLAWLRRRSPASLEVVAAAVDPVPVGEGPLHRAG